MTFRNKEQEPFIPPTENAQRIARREKCACGEVLELPFDASAQTIEEAVKRHQKTPKHVAWWAYVQASQ